jgi:23S rRNA (cytidine1920-2'-O)/16S rRNA (cytidine1409-2'-O)-methyltransferase
MKKRLDNFLVENNFFNSRSKAQNAIKEGAVFVSGKKATKAGTMVEAEIEIEIKDFANNYVSRAGLKLEKAAREFDLTFAGKIMLDIGSSTGGFVDCALQKGVKKVIAVDVGTNQLVSKLREDKRVEVFEQTDFRYIDNKLVSEVNIITIDVSFISVTLLLEKIAELKNAKEVICLIKPQFECGKTIARKYKGVINDKKVHIKIIERIIDSFMQINFNIQNLTFSAITGKKGNIEYLAYFSRDELKRIDINNIVEGAFKIF